MVEGDDVPPNKSEILILIRAGIDDERWLRCALQKWNVGYESVLKIRIKSYTYLKAQCHTNKIHFNCRRNLFERSIKVMNHSLIRLIVKSKPYEPALTSR